MPNTFLTSADIAAVASVALIDTPTLLRSSYRNASVDMSNTSGGVVKIRKPIVTTTGEIAPGGTYVAQDVNQAYATITCDKVFYQRIEMNSSELALSVGDFNANVLAPAITGLTGDIEKFLLKRLALQAGIKDFVAVTDFASVLAKIEKLNEAKVQSLARNAYISPKTESTLMGLEAFANAAFRGDAEAAKKGVAGMVAGVNWVRTNRILTPGTAPTGTIKIAAIAAIDATSIGIKGATGTAVYTGTIVTIGTEKYLVVEDAAITSGAATLKLDRGLVAAVAVDDAVTITSKKLNVLVGDPSCLAVVMAPFQPLPGVDSTVRTEEGISIRVTLSMDNATMKTICTIDLQLGAEVITPEGVLTFIE